MTPFAHAFAYAIKKTPYAFFAEITLCMYILCVAIEAVTDTLVKLKLNRIMLFKVDEQTVTTCTVIYILACIAKST